MRALFFSLLGMLVVFFLVVLMYEINNINNRRNY